MPPQFEVLDPLDVVGPHHGVSVQRLSPRSRLPAPSTEWQARRRLDQPATFTEISGLVIACSLIATIFKLRAPGMALNRMPLFVWAELVTSFMVVFSMPSIMIASTTLITDPWSDAL